MNRRGFLGLLGSVAATAVLDPERLLWKPGQKLISIPAPSVPSLWMGDIFTISGLVARDGRPITFVAAETVSSGDSQVCLWPPVIPDGQYMNSSKTSRGHHFRRLGTNIWLPIKGDIVGSSLTLQAPLNASA